MSDLPKNSPIPPLKAFYFHEPFEQNYWPDILEEVYKKKVYQQFLPVKKEGAVCYDVGANVGLTTYYFAQYFGVVHSFEPSAQHMEALSTMVKTNHLKNVFLHKTALSNENGKTRFYHNDNQTMFSMEATVNKQDDFEEVPTMDLESIMKELGTKHINLMKLDVEGSEGKIVNSEGFKRVADKIDAITGEWHNWSNISQPNFQHALEDLGYQFRWRHDTAAQVFEAQRI